LRVADLDLLARHALLRRVHVLVDLGRPSRKRGARLFGDPLDLSDPVVTPPRSTPQLAGQLPTECSLVNMPSSLGFVIDRSTVSAAPRSPWRSARLATRTAS
jgi:hypothetical protein